MDSLDQASVPPHRRLVDRLSPRLVVVLTALGFGLPVVGYVLFVIRFSVDAIVGDQWSDVTLIGDSYSHFFDWGQMWAQHNENRIFFPNLMVILLAHTAHFDVRIEEFLSAVMLFAAISLLLWAHKRRSSSVPWLYYCPVVFVMVSVVQYGNTIWGFQMAWYLVLLSLASAIVLLDRTTLTWLSLGGAMVAAMVGSFSSLQGLLIWPTGLVLFYFRRRSRPQFVMWMVGFIASALIYFYKYNFSVSPAPGYARQHPLAALKFFLFAMGDVVGKPVTIGTSNSTNTYVVLLGLVLLVLAVGTVLICGVRPDRHGSSPVGVSLICFGLLFSASITQGRAYYGYGGASFSRYTTFDMLTLVGIYLALMGHRLGPDRSGVPGVGPSHARSGPDVRAHGWKDRLAPGAIAVMLGIMALQVVVGTHYGLRNAHSFHAYEVTSADALRSIDHLSNAQVRARIDVFVPASYLRARARILQEHRLSVFAEG